ncbi:UTP--glucose-1-phosphate uridylyltransferase [Bowdeniella nasicola]|uniref:UTP--glucose-1-phosphate uridylyltransferase n=1 Tax=Bowdeniella nasicola TaxID=208480 RepID=A0A1H4DTG7_9ACTO|nr:UTP--glucose-1-phosphate uridylyltransferase [Bowdeniella nasicola]SEA75808.1 UTP--glucose-1-phosphate uridylyltransferase [Bowdeniella nasicola]
MSEKAPVTRARKAVIPVAGLGTRLLPASKAIPKEMITVVDRPAIQYVVEEAAKAGLDDVLLISNRGKDAIIDHFDDNLELARTLKADGKDALLASIEASANLGHVHVVRQGEAKGLGHAVAQGRDHVGNEPFAVLLGDDFTDPRDELLSVMIDVQEKVGGSVIALLEVEPEQISAYGAAVVEPAPEAGRGDDVVRVISAVEKPAVEDAPSNLAIIGRYVLSPAVFDVLDRTKPGKGGEIQLTDALMELAEMDKDAGGGVYGVVFRGRRYDTGAKLDYLKAIVQIGADRDDLGEDFVAWLREFVADYEVPEVRITSGFAD